MNLEPFHKIVNKVMGLAPDSMGRSGIMHALKVRMRETGSTEAQYLNLVQNSETELAELIEEIVVPETWFFRDGRPFDLLFETASGRRKSEFRVLSAPCSTGEEPYSIAMTLLGAGLDPARFRVDGVDISERAINRARAGVYTENSFRSGLPLYAEGCFRNSEKGRILSARVRDAVNFYAGNIVDGCLPTGRYDAIFCRNLLIYLDDKSRLCLASLLNDKLKDDGLLFVGHAELLPVFNDWFTPVRRQGVFALRKGKRKVAALFSEAECVKPYCVLQKSGRVTRKLERRERQPVKPVVPARVMPVPSVEAVAVKDDPVRSIEDAKALADSGRISEALALCNELLRDNGPAPELFHLSGLLHEAGGNLPQAEDCYGKALYLEPESIESLVHLALLLETKGESRKAEILRKRIRRVETRNEDG